jgi:hypothetical protein
VLLIGQQILHFSDNEVLKLMQEHGVFSGIDPQSGAIAPESVEQPRLNAEVCARWR